MGIRKLAQDLSPYARPVAIGHSKIEHDMPVIDKVVIDGPALVHYIYFQLAKEKQDDFPSVISQPLYSTICSRVKDFIATLQEHQVNMCVDKYRYLAPVS